MIKNRFHPYLPTAAAGGKNEYQLKHDACCSLFFSLGKLITVHRNSNTYSSAKKPTTDRSKSVCLSRAPWRRAGRTRGRVGARVQEAPWLLPALAQALVEHFGQEQIPPLISTLSREEKKVYNPWLGDSASANGVRNVCLHLCLCLTWRHDE